MLFSKYYFLVYIINGTSAVLLQLSANFFKKCAFSCKAGAKVQKIIENREWGNDIFSSCACFPKVKNQ